MIIETIILIALFVFLIALFWTFKHEVFSPWNTTLSVWVIILTLYVTVDHGLYNIEPKFIYAILLWVLPFCFSSFVAFKLTPNNNSKGWDVCEKNVDYLTILTLLAVPYALYKALTNALKILSPEGLFYTLREQFLEPELNTLGPISYLVYLVYALLFIEANRTNIRKWRLMLAYAFGIMFFMITMSKQGLFIMIIPSMYLLYSNKKISLKPFFYFFIGFFLFAVILQFFRGEGEQEFDTDSALWLFSIYVISPMQAFCTDIANSSHYFGEYTLRPIYNIMNGFGANIPLAPTIDKFINVPLPTNVYTVMSPFFRDFGYTGIAVFAVIEGILTGVCFKLSTSGNTIMKYLYSYLIVSVFLQFFDEGIFKGMSGMIYFLVFIFLCHIKFTFKKKQSTIQSQTND